MEIKYRNIKILVGCEESQVVTIAFRKRGFEAYSCDIQDCSGGHPEWHIKGDVLEVINGGGYNLLIGHPPCTYISYVGNRWFNYDKYGHKAIQRGKNRMNAIEFFIKMWEAPIEHICLENPKGWIMEFIKPTQIIQPYFFGDNVSKTTCLWLKNLQKLQHSSGGLFYERTHVEKGEMCSAGSKDLFGTDIWSLPKDEISRLRSKTFPGIANAMAQQWGYFLIEKYR